MVNIVTKQRTRREQRPDRRARCKSPGHQAADKLTERDRPHKEVRTIVKWSRHTFKRLRKATT